MFLFVLICVIALVIIISILIINGSLPILNIIIFKIMILLKQKINKKELNK
jgi:hypothetical protein